MTTFKEKQYSVQLLAQTGRSIKRALPKVKSAIKGIKRKGDILALNPGAITNREVIVPGIQSPLTTVAMKAVPGVPLAPFIKTIGKPEKKMWKFLGKDKALKNASDRYSHSRASRQVEGAINGLVNGAKQIIGGI